MKILCINETKGLTKGNSYNVIREGIKPNSKFNINGYFVINDLGKEKHYQIAPMGITVVLPIMDKYVRYINESNNSITNGKVYQLLDKQSDQYHYFIDDKGRFGGFSLRNYFGGDANFEDVTQEMLRDIKMNSILNELT